MKTRLSIKVILLIVFMCTLSVLVACSKIEKGRNLMSKNEKVIKIEIGKTYTMSWCKSDMKEEDRSLEYIKLLDDKTFMYVSDGTQRSKEYYQADGDYKVISIETGTYEKEGENFIQKTYLSYQTLSFSRDIDVKKGSIGEISDFMTGNKLFDNGEIAMTIIEKYDGYYRINSNNPESIPSDALRISDVKLPDTVEEFLAQYKLTSEDNKKSSDVKPQSYGRTEKKMMFDPAQFPVHREDDGTIWVGF